MNTAHETFHGTDKQRGPLPNIEAHARAVANGTTICAEQEQEAARRESAKLLPAETKKLADALRKLEAERAKVDAAQSHNAQIIIDWHRLQDEAQELRQRAEHVAIFAEQNKSGIAELQRRLREFAGQLYDHTWKTYFVDTVTAQAAHKLIESTLAERRAAHAAKRAELAAFAKKHGLPADESEDSKED